MPEHQYGREYDRVGASARRLVSPRTVLLTRRAAAGTDNPTSYQPITLTMIIQAFRQYAAYVALIAIFGSFALGSLSTSTKVAQAAIAVPGPSVLVSSSTAFTIGGGSSLRVLATTTGATGARLGALFQTTGCTSDVANVFLNAENDLPATAGQGFLVHSTSTLSMGYFPYLPTPQGSVQATSTNGTTCTLLVTEFLQRVP